MSELQRIEATTTLETLAEQINEEHRAFKAAVKTALERGIHCGELLREAKARCKHGTWLSWLENTWLSWLENNFEGSRRTAQVYMQLYEKRDEIRAKYADSAHLSISGALKEIAAPEEPVDAASRGTEVLGNWFGCPSFEAFEDACERYRRGEARAYDEWSAHKWEYMANLDRNGRAGWFREVAIPELASWGVRGEGIFILDQGLGERHWSNQLDMLEAIVRPVDIPPSRERFSLEETLTYREMHLTLLELDVVLAEKALLHEQRWQAEGNSTVDEVLFAEGQLEKARKRLQAMQGSA